MIIPSVTPQDFSTVRIQNFIRTQGNRLDGNLRDRSLINFLDNQNDGYSNAILSSSSSVEITIITLSFIKEIFRWIPQLIIYSTRRTKRTRDGCFYYNLKLLPWWHVTRKTIRRQSEIPHSESDVQPHPLSIQRSSCPPQKVFSWRSPTLSFSLQHTYFPSESAIQIKRGRDFMVMNSIEFGDFYSSFLAPESHINLRESPNHPKCCSWY